MGRTSAPLMSAMSTTGDINSGREGNPEAAHLVDICTPAGARVSERVLDGVCQHLLQVRFLCQRGADRHRQDGDDEVGRVAPGWVCRAVALRSPVARIEQVPDHDAEEIGSRRQHRLEGFDAAVIVGCHVLVVEHPPAHKRRRPCGLGLEENKVQVVKCREFLRGPVIWHSSGIQLVQEWLRYALQFGGRFSDGDEGASAETRWEHLEIDIGPVVYKWLDHLWEHAGSIPPDIGIRRMRRVDVERRAS
ncbi:hypothetical protein VTK56DRAFT_9225 [Thermocarpiscus australiensis]